MLNVISLPLIQDVIFVKLDFTQITMEFVRHVQFKIAKFVLLIKCVVFAIKDTFYQLLMVHARYVLVNVFLVLKLLNVLIVKLNMH